MGRWDGIQARVDVTKDPPRWGGSESHLVKWFLEGAGGAIHWGTSGDFDTCVAIAGKHFDPERAKGFCASLHHAASGAWPGHAPGEHHKSHSWAGLANNIPPSSYQPDRNEADVQAD